MPGDDLLELAEMIREPLDHVNRTVLTSRAPKGNSQITAIVLAEGGQPFFNELSDVGE